MDITLDQSSRLDNVSIKYLNVQNGVRMKSWRPSQVVIFFSPNPALPKRFIFDRFLFLAQTDVVAGWGTRKVLDLVHNQLLWSFMPSMCVYYSFLSMYVFL